MSSGRYGNDDRREIQLSCLTPSLRADIFFLESTPRRAFRYNSGVRPYLGKVRNAKKERARSRGAEESRGNYRSDFRSQLCFCGGSGESTGDPGRSNRLEGGREGD